VKPEQRRTDFEESALRSLISALQLRGHNAVDVGCPELDPSDPLNIDARFEIDDVAWAVEHCRIVYDSDMIAAHQYAEDSLRPFGNELAHKYGVRLTVALYPPRWQLGQNPPIAFFNRIKKRMEASAQSGLKDQDRECQIYVTAGEPEFEISFFTANDPLVRMSFASDMGPLTGWFCQSHGTTPVASYGTTLRIHQCRPKRHSAGPPTPMRRRPHGIQGGHSGSDSRGAQALVAG